MDRKAVPALADLLARNRTLFGPDNDSDANSWADFQSAPPVPVDPVESVIAAMGRVHAALPLLTYGWALQVQGQFRQSENILNAAVALSEETEQRSLASLAYHQLAVTVRLLGDAARGHVLNEQSKALNHQVHGTAAQLASLWPRISSGYQALESGQLDLAADRLHRVARFLADRDSFRTHRNSTVIGLGLVALAQGDLAEAERLLNQGLADPQHRYPFTYVKGILGQAHLAHLRGNGEEARRLLQRALGYAARRSLVREYAECVEAILSIRPPGAPLTALESQVETVQKGEPYLVKSVAGL